MKLGMEFWIDYAHSVRGHPQCGRDHGHTAKIQIEIEGSVKGGTSYQQHMIMDFADMKKVCKEVLEKLDHQNLNKMFEFPTSENIVQWIFDQLKERVPVSKITFFEGKGKWCTIAKMPD